MKIKIAVITSSRADYGLLYHPIKELVSDSDFEVFLIVTGSHLVQTEGMSVEVIKKDGFEIFAQVPIFSENRDENLAINGSSNAVKFISQVLIDAKPHSVLLLGDRYEILASAISATLLNIPIIHLCGGDITEGAIDNVIRHAITKLSHIHFPSNQQAARRIEQMGEDPEHIFMVGSTGLDYIKDSDFISKEEIFRKLSIEPSNIPFFLITFHPVTLESDHGESQLNELIIALTEYIENNNCLLIFTGVNLDPGSINIYTKIIEFCKINQCCYYFSSLGSKYYINLLKCCEAVIGNSSSGFYEAPFLKKPTINIGMRQTGRPGCESIITVSKKADIINALGNLNVINLNNVVSPYGDGKSSKRMKIHLKEIGSFEKLLVKKFRELN